MRPGTPEGSVVLENPAEVYVASIAVFHAGLVRRDRRALNVAECLRKKSDTEVEVELDIAEAAIVIGGVRRYAMDADPLDNNRLQLAVGGRYLNEQLVESSHPLAKAMLDSYNAQALLRTIVAS